MSCTYFSLFKIFHLIELCSSELRERLSNIKVSYKVHLTQIIQSDLTLHTEEPDKVPERQSTPESEQLRG